MTDTATSTELTTEATSTTAHGVGLTDAAADKVKSLMAAPTVVDARNLLDPVNVRRHGFIYDGIGRL